MFKFPPGIPDIMSEDSLSRLLLALLKAAIIKSWMICGDSSFSVLGSIIIAVTFTEPFKVTLTIPPPLDALNSLLANSFCFFSNSFFYCCACSSTLLKSILIFFYFLIIIFVIWLSLIWFLIGHTTYYPLAYTVFKL